jgi:electron transport complex protein RnfB
MAENDENITRRDLLSGTAKGACLLGLGGLAALVGDRLIPRQDQDPAKPDMTGTAEMVWQIDPYTCTACGSCATQCVLEPSAVKCVNWFKICGYCDLCFGYFVDDPAERGLDADNQLCPTNAIRRKFIEEPYYEYTIDEPLCIGCGRCVKGCKAFGNASMYLQVRHDLCLNCNECTIASACPVHAFRRVPADRPYLLKSEERGG